MAMTRELMGMMPSPETFYGNSQTLLGELTLERRYTEVLLPRQNFAICWKNKFNRRSDDRSFSSHIAEADCL